MAELEAYLEELGAAGSFDSAGRFTLDHRVALEKLRKFRLDDPRRCLCNLLACAVLSGARRFWFRGGWLGWTVAHDGRAPTAQELRDLFTYLLSSEPSSRALKELGLGVHGALQLEAARVEILTARAGLVLRPDGASTWKPGQSGCGLEVRMRCRSRQIFSRLGQPPEAGVLVHFGGFAPLELRIDGHLLERPGITRGLACRKLVHPDVPTSGWSQPAFLEDQVESPGDFAGCLLFVNPLDVRAGSLSVVSDGLHFLPARSDLGYRCGYALVWCSGMERDLSLLSLVENPRLDALRDALRPAFDDLALELARRPDLWSQDPNTAYAVLADLVCRLRARGKDQEVADLPLLERSDGERVSARSLEGVRPISWRDSAAPAPETPQLLGGGVRQELLELLVPEAREMVQSHGLLAPRYLRGRESARLLDQDYLVRVEVRGGELGFGPRIRGARLTLYCDRQLASDTLCHGEADLSLAFPHGSEAVLEVSRDEVRAPPTSGLARLCQALAAYRPPDRPEQDRVMALVTQCFATAGRLYVHLKGRLRGPAGGLDLSVPPYTLMLTGRRDSEALFYREQVAELLALDRLAEVPLVLSCEGELLSMRDLGDSPEPWYYGGKSGNRMLWLREDQLAVLRLFLGLGRICSA